MTLIVVDEGGGPHIHALVIGVGGYEHLKDGTGTKLPRLQQFGNLGQLTSPPRSAIAMVDVLRAPEIEWAVPLGTIEFLVSPAPGDSDPANNASRFEPATRAAIQAAFDSWWDRCDSNKDNIAFFYVAGHGVEGLDQIVLASDFGQSPNQPWLQAFNVSETRRALTSNRAQTQVFLVDACREVTTSNVETPNAAAPALRSPSMRQQDNCLFDLTITATTRTRKAYGPPRETSYFASAVVAGLLGGAGMKSDGEWWITTGKLSERFYSLMELAGADTNRQRPIPVAPRTFRLAKLRTPPPARLQLLCQPEEATVLAELSWRQGNLPPQRRTQRAREAWTIDVAPGLYYVGATFPNAEYTDREHDVVVEPPLTCERIVVT